MEVFAGKHRILIGDILVGFAKCGYYRITLAASDGNILRLVRDRCYFFFSKKNGDGRMMEPTIFSQLQIYKSTYEKTTRCLSFMMKIRDRDGRCFRTIMLGGPPLSLPVRLPSKASLTNFCVLPKLQKCSVIDDCKFF